MKRTLFIIALATLAISVPFALAQEGETPQINPNLPLGGTGEAPTGIGGVVFGVYRFALLIAGLLAFGAIVYGGIKYAASGGNASMQEDARAWITQAIWGIVLLLGATYLLGIINPDLTKLRQSPPCTSVNTSTNCVIQQGDPLSLDTVLTGPSQKLYGCPNGSGGITCSLSPACSGISCSGSGACTPVDRSECAGGTTAGLPPDESYACQATGDGIFGCSSSSTDASCSKVTYAGKPVQCKSGCVVIKKTACNTASPAQIR